MTEQKTVSKEITPQAVDFSRWYIDTIKKADLMDYTPVRGCMVFKPDGYELWENIQKIFDKRFKETGHRNAYFPMLIPESFFSKEKDHIEGFSPELPWVTEVAGEKLAERLALRPTSETMVGYMYSQWIQSYRDLPLLLNQWANVFRWEKRTLPFIRTSEFLWQEGHTAHVDEADARKETLQMLEIYREVIEQELAIPACVGQKTPSEKFAGAVDTYTVELMMRDGKAVQSATSHYLGDRFAKAFEIQYSDKENKQQYVHTTSWGTTTRLIGSIIMVHGDDKGLMLPPRIAPCQLIIIPVGPPKKRELVMSHVTSLAATLKQCEIRYAIDERDESPGWKFNEWEMRGVPLRLEIGPRDIEAEQVILARRDTGEKMTVSIHELAEIVPQLLSDIQQNMLHRARQFQNDHAHQHIQTLEALEAHIKDTELPGWILAGWCGSEECEQKVKAACSYTTRCIPFEPPVKQNNCLVCQDVAQHTVWFAKSY